MTPQMPAPKQSHLLIVDDIPANIQVLRDILHQDYKLYFATSGEQGLQLAASLRPDLILLDVMMPVMNGYEVCRRLKADPVTRDIPVIFVTALSEIEDEAHGLELGAVDYLIKPVSPPIVKARVRNYLLLKQQFDQLQALSRLDGLTGIANRRRFDEVLALELSRSMRNRTPLSLILSDIDLFKSFNDRQGHLAGDACLKQVAAALAAVVSRPADLVARYGGEEFVCLLPETGPSGAWTLAEVQRQAVRELRIPHPDSPYEQVTISAGVATCIPTPGTTPEDLIALADRALYRAKRTGRDRVVRHEPPAPDAGDDAPA